MLTAAPAQKARPHYTEQRLPEEPTHQRGTSSAYYIDPQPLRASSSHAQEGAAESSACRYHSFDTVIDPAQEFFRSKRQEKGGIHKSTRVAATHARSLLRPRRSAHRSLRPTREDRADRAEQRLRTEKAHPNTIAAAHLTKPPREPAQQRGTAAESHYRDPLHLHATSRAQEVAEKSGTRRDRSYTATGPAQEILRIPEA